MIAEYIEGTTAQNLQEFLTNSPWDYEQLNSQRVKLMVERATRKDGSIIIDDTGFPKDGKCSVGVSRQYSGTLGKVGNCQIAVSLQYTDSVYSWPVNARLYLVCQKNSGLLVVIVAGRENLFFLELPCNLAGTSAAGAQIEYPLHNGSGFLVGNNLFLGICLVILVAVGRSNRYTFAPFSLGFYDRPYFLAGVPGVEIVEQVFEWSEVVVTV